MNDKSSNINCDIQRNIQVQFDYIQIKNAIELCDNVSDYPLKVFLLAKLTSFVIFHYSYF